MGNRSNVVIDYGSNDKVYLYGHWLGEDSIQVVRDVLSRGQRWDDAPYLARMIFDAMIADEQGNESGYGIVPFLLDSEHPIIYLDPNSQTLRIKDYDDNLTLSECTFEQFIETTEYEFETLIHTLNAM